MTKMVGFLLFIFVGIWPLDRDSPESFRIMSCHTSFFRKLSFMRLIDSVTTRDDLADLLHVRRSLLTYVLYVAKPDSYYETFYIPKKNGDLREIEAPGRELKSIQKRLAFEISAYQRYMYKQLEIETNIAHAFLKGKSIITNAKIHKNKKYIVNIDLKDFFHTIHFGRVKGFFEKNEYYKLPSDVATIIAQLTCYHGRLPQGAPTSPVISNLICQVFDYRVLKIAKKFRLDYTRYADDLTFSTNKLGFWDEYPKFLSELAGEIHRSGFAINDAKTRIVKRESKQTVTGLTVNKKVNVDRAFYRNTKAMTNYLYKTGSFTIDGQPGTLNMLEGRYSFIDQITRYNNKIEGKKPQSRVLNAREKDYQKFLFYKYFFANERPLIITEGKTDVLYIKAALKKLSYKYPQLIIKRPDGSFEYKISFFRRTPRIRYFFQISQDGADAIASIYQLYAGKDDKHNYYKRIANQTMQNAVVFLFDNETQSERPLKKFIDAAKVNAAQEEELKNNLYIRMIDNSKLFLATTPLGTEDEESEIEDLFTKATLDTIIDGRQFTRKGKYDTTKYYGKEIFSKYVFDHYEKIDFTGFIPLLNAINKVVEV